MADITKIGTRYRNPDERKQLDWPRIGGGKCCHVHFLVDDSKALVECADCGEQLNPMWVLTQLMSSESKWNQTRERYQDEMMRLAERSRTKCRHCGKMTEVSRR